MTALHENTDTTLLRSAASIRRALEELKLEQVSFALG